MYWRDAWSHVYKDALKRIHLIDKHLILTIVFQCDKWWIQDVRKLDSRLDYNSKRFWDQNENNLNFWGSKCKE
jgi:hypothetical protein